MFLSEHWLTPHKVSVFSNRFNGNNMRMNMKYNIDPDSVLIVRPHGGIGFIGNRVDGIVYKPVSADNDRICGVQLISNGKIILTVFGVYVPYYKGTSEQIQHYSETLDILQSTLDTMQPSPVLIVGDMYTVLPRQRDLARRGHSSYPFNTNSYMLYDFLLTMILH